MDQFLYPFVGITAISVSSSLVIIVVFFLLKNTRILRHLNYLVALSAGMLLSNSLFHLLPEAYEHSGHSKATPAAMLGGIIVFFGLEMLLHLYHPHDPDHIHEADHVHNPSTGYMLLISDAIHKIMDGVIITAAYSISPLMGNATTLAILFHEIPQRVSNFLLLVKTQFSPLKALWFSSAGSFFSGLLGMLLVIYNREQIGNFIIFVTPFIAGAFFYIAATDLLPQLLRDVSHESIGKGSKTTPPHGHILIKKYLIQFFFLILGMAAIAFFTPDH